MSLKINKLGNGRIEIKCGGETAVVYGIVVKQPSLSFDLSHEPFMLHVIRPGRPGHGWTFSLGFPITDNDQRLEIDALAAQLERLPEFQKVLSVMRSRTPDSPGAMLITGDDNIL
jgi:hypothetical protein